MLVRKKLKSRSLTVSVFLWDIEELYSICKLLKAFLALCKKNILCKKLHLEKSNICKKKSNNVGFFLRRNFNLSFAKAINIFITYNMITATSSLSSGMLFEVEHNPLRKGIKKLNHSCTFLKLDQTINYSLKLRFKGDYYELLTKNLYIRMW